MHESRVHGDAMQPRGQGGITTKRRQLPECLNEGLLGEIVGIRRVVGHTKAYCIHAPLVDLEQRGKRIRVTLQRPLNKDRVGVAIVRMICHRRLDGHGLHVPFSVNRKYGVGSRREIGLAPYFDRCFPVTLGHVLRQKLRPVLESQLFSSRRAVIFLFEKRNRSTRFEK
jgi:hypothetical protein